MTRLSEHLAYAMAFCLAILLALLLLMLVRSILARVMELTFKGKIERFGGALAGFIRAMTLAVAVILFMSLVPNDYLHALFVEDSVIGRTLYVYLPTMYSDLSERYPDLPALWDDKEDPWKDAPTPTAAGQVWD